MAEHVNVFLGERILQVQAATHGRSWASLSNWQEAVKLAAEHLRSGGIRRANLNVAVCGSLCRPFLFPERSSVSSWSTAQRLADHLGPTRTDLPKGSRVWIDPDPKAAFGTVLHPGLAAAVFTELGACGRIRRLTPWWADVLLQALHEQSDLGILGVHDDACFTVLAGSANELTHASSLTSMDTPAAALAAWARALTTINVSSSSARYTALEATIGEGHQGRPFMRAQWLGVGS